MMEISRKVSLKTLNTFGIDVKAAGFVALDEMNNLDFLIDHVVPGFSSFFILGGGSNVLFTKDYDGLVIHPENRGIEMIPADDEHMLVRVGAGEVWADLVDYCVERGLGGIENLALIPGRAGAAPVQNIGAYGVEFSDVLYSLEAFDTAEKCLVNINTEACCFGYRDSIFKRCSPGRYLILSVTLRLSRKPVPQTSYKALSEELRQLGINKPGIREVRDTVARIRRSKLPDPSLIGNAGSFFKNPVISQDDYNVLKHSFTDIPYYIGEHETVKIPAGWLIERCGWKGKRLGRAGVHHLQSLVIVNLGGASGTEILELAIQIQQSVRNLFGIKLEPEVNIL